MQLLVYPSVFFLLIFSDIFFMGLFCGQEEVAEIVKVTHRLAVVNMDWTYVKVCY